MSGPSRRHTPIDFSDLKQPGAAAAAAPTPRGPVTGVGLMSAALAGKAQLEQQVQEQQQRIEQLKGERGAIKLDPHLVAPSRWANRHVDSFSGSEFEELKGEIQDAGGNVQPIMVRPLETPAADGARYELVFGHRRHRACLDLGLDVLAVVAEVDDRGLWEAMERENRGRANLSAWEQGVMYRRALDEGLFPSMRTLAQAIGRQHSQISRALAVAGLPAEVVAAFRSPIEIQFNWVDVINRALERDEGAVLAEARRLAGQQAAAKRVLELLVSAPQSGAPCTTGLAAAPVAPPEKPAQAPDSGAPCTTKSLAPPVAAPAALPLKQAPAPESGAPCTTPRRLDLGRGRHADVRMDGQDVVIKMNAALCGPDAWAELEQALREVVERAAQ